MEPAQIAIEAVKKESAVIKEILYRLKDALYQHSHCAGSPDLSEEVNTILTLVQRLENDSYRAKYEY